MSTNGKHDHRRTYWKIWGILILLTAITVWTSYHDFGTWNIAVAMAIATTKAALVALFFMHLKYDNKIDIVTFVSSFVFLGIFVGLTASDLLDRETTTPVAVATSAGGMDMGDVGTLAKPSPELIAKGKTLYATNCASCHGADGKGDGPAAASFNPKPRNFTAGEWKNGGKPSQIFATLTSGFNSMPSFAALSAGDRWALVHFIRSLSPNRPEDSANDLTALAAKAKASGKRLPVRVAMALMAVPDEPPSFDFHKSPLQANSEGGHLYQSRCASCHGEKGLGGIPVRVLGANPFSYLSTRSFAGSRAAWVGNLQEFVRINTEGLPGYGKPGVADLTQAQWQALYSYVQQLAGTH